MADEFLKVARESAQTQNVTPELPIAGQKWFRAARELLVRQSYSGLPDFEECCGDTLKDFMCPCIIRLNTERLLVFERRLRNARSILLALEEELLSRELPVKSELSFEVAADEFQKAQVLLDQGKGDEVFLRAAGVVARVALERHLFTVVHSRTLTIILNPPSKRNPDISDVIHTLVTNGIITAVTRSQLVSLLTIANNCAHPREAIRQDDIQRLIKDGHSTAAAIR